MEYEELLEDGQKYIEIFENSLKGLSEKTVNRHVRNVQRFLDDAAFCEGKNALEAIDYLYMFVSYNLIHKGFCSKERVREYLSSIKRFYNCLHDEKLVSDEALEDVLIEVDSLKDDAEWMIN